jgi:hypothetical protein
MWVLPLLNLPMEGVPLLMTSSPYGEM